MILTQGEKLVWAVAFERRLDEIRKKTLRPLTPEELESAILNGWVAVSDLRRSLPNLNANRIGNEPIQMLRTMLERREET